MTCAHVLVLDSHPDAAETLALALSQEGVTCSFAICAQDAMEIVAARKPRAILLDFDFRGASVENFCAQVRILAPDTPIIAISGWTDQAHFQLAMKCGFDRYLFKPASIAAVLRALQQDPALNFQPFSDAEQPAPSRPAT